MKLAPREVEKVALHNAGFLAQKRLARGLRLNYTEAVALIATQVLLDPILMAVFLILYHLLAFIIRIWLWR